jgi:hypothetical protein
MDTNEKIIKEIFGGEPKGDQIAFKTTILDELLPLLPIELKLLLPDRAGAARFLKRMPEIFEPQSVLEIDNKKESNQRAWELVGYFYKNLRRFYESLAIFHGLDSTRKCNKLVFKEYFKRCLEVKAFSWA